MALPIRTTLEDIKEVCEYLSTKPTGATLAEAKTVLDSKRLDGRKLTALKYWGLIVDDDDKLKTTTSGRELAKGADWLLSVLSGVVRNIPPYRAIVERAAHRKEEELTSTDVAAHWHEHFRSDVGLTDSVVGDQAMCFFHIAQGAGLGNIVQGRKGNITRFKFAADKIQNFIRGTGTNTANIKHAFGMQPTKSFESNLGGAHTQIDEIESISAASAGDNYYLQRGLEIDCYKLIDRLGSGFSAEVWSATVQRVPPGVELAKDQKVAVKFYTANALAIPDQVIRVEREYRVAQRLRHPNLIRIYEFVLASPRPNHNFLVMDIAPGSSLATALKETKFNLDDSLKIIAQIFSGADALHSAGALHRDIKPGNIAIAKQEVSLNCLLLDLGIVSPMFEKSVTAVSRFVGSKHWAPLEQLVGENLDERSDIYSIGAVAYNLLVGVEPFSRSATEAAVAVEMSRSALAIPELANIPSGITEMLNACLSNNPNNRPRNARECLAVLKRHGVEP